MKAVKDMLMITGDEFDAAIMPIMLGVKGYMTGAGVSESLMYSNAGIVAITLGTNDLWNLTAGEAKFSGCFLGIVNQLRFKSDEAKAEDTLNIPGH